MRKQLKNLGNEERHRFIGTVDKFGLKSNIFEAKQTIMLKNIKLVEEDRIVTDHLWFTVGKQLYDLNLHQGDVISFDARVDVYWKGYMGYREDVMLENPVRKDYKLARPTKFEVVSRAVEYTPPEIPYKIPNILEQDKITDKTFMSFGKYSSSTMEEITKKDASYCNWLLENIECKALKEYLTSKRVAKRLLKGTKK